MVVVVVVRVVVVVVVAAVVVVVVVADNEHQCKAMPVSITSLSPPPDVFLIAVLPSLSSRRTFPWQHATRNTPHAAPLPRTVKPITTSIAQSPLQVF